MTGLETWLDTGRAPDLASCIGAAQQIGATTFNVYMGGRYAYLGGGASAGWTSELAQGLHDAGYDLFGSWVSLSPGQSGYALGYQDGLDAVRVARANYPMLQVLSWDIEPSTWWANQSGVNDAMRGFHEAVEAGGYGDMPYGWEGTLAGCPWADFLWIASPGYSDPAHVRPQLPDDFLPGRRSVQFGSLDYAGTTWDVSHSEFSLGGYPMAALTPDQQQQMFDWLYNLSRQFATPLVAGGVGDILLSDNKAIRQGLTDLAAAIATLQVTVSGLTVPSPDLTALQADATAIKGAVDRIEAALKGA